MRQRILRYLENKGITRYKFYQETGLSNGFLDKESKINATSYEKISYQYPDLNMEWVRTGKGSMLKEAVSEEVEEEDREELVGVPKLSAVEITDEEDYEKAVVSGVRLIPEYDQDFRGGDMGELLSNVHPIGFWQIPTGKAEFVVSVSGDSMAPVLPSGSRIAVRSLGFDKSHPNSIPFGSIFAVSVEDPITGESVGYVKYLRRHSDPTLAKRYWIARSANAECYDDFDIEIERVRALFIVECMMNRLI